MSKLLARRSLISVMVLAVGVSSAAGQTLPAAGLQADARILVDTLRTLHPGLYRYQTPAQFDARVAALLAEFGHDQSLAEAYLALSAFTAAIKCGHSFLNPSNQSDAVAAALLGGANRVPFTFRWRARRMVVTRDFTPDHALPAGTEIDAINGIQVATILARLMPLARADGGNDAKRVQTLEATGGVADSAFDLFFPLVFPDQPRRMLVDARLPGAATSVRRAVTPLTRNAREAVAKAARTAMKGGTTPAFTWRILPDGAAYLGMPSWRLYDSAWDWRGWLAARFADPALAHAPALVIDLRGNEGGDDAGSVLLSHLISSDLTPEPIARLVRYRKAPADLLPYLRSWDPSFRDWGAQARELARLWPTAPAVPYLALGDTAQAGGVVHPVAPIYRGPVYVLVDAANSSATFLFASLLRQAHRGTLVGEPTGGNQRGINGGAFFFLHLPRSGLEVDIPLIGYFPARFAPDSGLNPDIFVRPTPADIAAGRDVALAAVRAQERPVETRAR